MCHKCKCSCPLEVTALNVTTTTATFELNSVPAICNKEYFTLLITCPMDIDTASESLLPVSINIDGTAYPLIDRAGDIVRLGQMRGSRVCGCNVRPSRYRIQYGSDGLPAAIKHFTVHEGLCPLKV